MPIASTRPNSDSMLSEKPNAAIAANVPMSEIGIASSGMKLARQVCRNTSTTITTRTTASYKRVDHRVDRFLDEDRRVVDDAVFEPLGKVRRELLHHLLHAFGSGDRVRAGPLGDRERHGRFVVQIAVDRVVAGPQFDAGDVAHAHDAAIVAGLDDDLLELVGLQQPARAC